MPDSINLAVGVALALTAGTILAAQTLQEDAEPSEPVQVPALEPGDWAAYEANGTFRNLRNLSSTVADATFHGERLVLAAETAQPPNRTGATPEATLVRAGPPGETPLLVDATTDQRPFLEAVPEYDNTSGIGMMARASWETDTGPLDAFIFEDWTARQGTHDATDIAPWITDLWPVEGLWNHTNLTVDVETLGGAPPRAEVDVQLRVEDPTPEAAGEVNRTPAGIIIRPSLSWSVNATYVLDETCPYPKSVAYEDGGKVLFEATRMACRSTGEPPSPRAVASGFEIERGTFEDSFPGEGLNYRLPYRGALEYFQALPDVQAFQAEHPDAVVSCAVLEERGGDDTVLANASWLFRFQEGDEAIARWVTRAGPSTAPLEDRWIVEQTERERHCLYEREAQELVDQAVARVEVLPEAVSSLLVHERRQDDAAWHASRVGPDGFTVSYSRCSVQECPNFQPEAIPEVHLDVEGRLDVVKVEPDWFAEPLRGLLTEPVDDNARAS